MLPHIDFGTWTWKTHYFRMNPFTLCSTTLHIRFNRTRELSIVIFFVVARTKRNIEGSLYLLSWFIAIEFISLSIYCVVLMCENVWFSCMANKRWSETESGTARTRRKKQMSKILFNSQRQPISITVIYCSCYRFQWSWIGISATKIVSHTFTCDYVSKAKLSNVEMKQVLLFWCSIVAVCCCCYARSAEHTTEIADIEL